MNFPSLSRVLLRYPWIEPTGADIAFSKDHPLSILPNSVIYFRPDRSAHSASVKAAPLNSIIRLVLELRACCVAVAHWQFPCSYPLAPLMRSMVCEDDGRVPMSFEKSLYEFSHLSHTVMGGVFPPYRRQSLKDGSTHLRIMVFQISYSGFLMLNLTRPAFWHAMHSTLSFLSRLTRELSAVSSCPFLQKFVLRLAGIRSSISYV